MSQNLRLHALFVRLRPSSSLFPQPHAERTHLVLRLRTQHGGVSAACDFRLYNGLCTE
jgi:hypothetical protein